MIKLENHLGTIGITEDYFRVLIGRAASSCFGVAGMANGNCRQHLRSFLKKAQAFDDQGILISEGSQGLKIELHIIITYGLNIAEICRSIENKVRYTVENATGRKVDSVKIHVDSMKSES